MSSSQTSSGTGTAAASSGDALGFQEISKLFSLPIADASSILGVCTSVLKRICRENGIVRWPYRKVFYSRMRVLQKKTALMLALCQFLRDKYTLAAVTNDIFTKEDGEFLVKHGALPEERIRAVETGGCPHAAIREDISINLGPLEELSNLYRTDILLCESGGDNLAANFSRELADFIIYIIDVSAGDKIPRKGGPGITQADLLVINKTDLAAAVGADLAVNERDSSDERWRSLCFFSGEAWSWCGGDCEPRFTSLGSSNGKKCH